MADIDDVWWREVTDPATGTTKRVKAVRHGQPKRWRARWRDGTGAQRQRSFERKADAEHHLRQVLAELTTAPRAEVDPRAGAVSLREYVEVDWLPSQVHLRPNSVAMYRSHLRNHILPAFGRRELASLRRPDMKRFVAATSGRLAPATTVTVFAILRSVLQGAVDDGLLSANPCSRVALPRVEPRVLSPLRAAQVLAVVREMTPYYRVAVWIGAGCGLRQGEVLGLTLPRIDLEQRRIKVEEQLQQGVLVPLKTRASRRTVPLDDVVVRSIREHLDERPPRDHQLLVTNRSHRPVRRSNFIRSWRLAVQKAGLPEGTRFHDLRHFYASTLIAAGLHPKTIQARLGHSTITETMDTYGHLFPDSEEHGRGALDSALGA
ncbi:tyrosine-type recombinase/integrase [Streptomyces sp. NPDC001380]|uniref:tyrosine-type recombinase/integrase n=1 Tax=Streptomyces sp. NPDC001380 TaxID=3364566 RepID=UPI003673E025